jgi:hypothetical protein
MCFLSNTLFFEEEIYTSILRFYFGCLLFRRCSLSFRNLLSCHTVSRVCHCQSHSDKQSANNDYGILKTFGCSLDYILKTYHMDIVRNGTVENNTFSPTQTIHPSIHPSIYLVSLRRRYRNQLSTRVMTDS